MRTKSGQALIELAVFGSIFLMILGAMLSYGLRYNFMQQANQIAYRRALKIASDPGRGSGSYSLVTDKHIPDPVDPFGVGSAIPVSATASVMRSYQLDAVPQMTDLKDDLPTTVVDIQDRQHNGVSDPQHRFVYTSAGFRWETPVGGGTYTQEQVQKYRLLYGTADMDPGAGFGNGQSAPTRIRLTDGCSGEVMDFNSCYEQAMRLVDDQACLKYCNDVNASGDVSCGTICSPAVQLNPPNSVSPAFPSSGNGPWYAANYTRNTSDAQHPATWYTFPVLNDLFSTLTSRGMGFQPGGEREQVRDTSVRRVESSGAMGTIMTEENVAWSDTTPKNFTYNNNLDPGTGDEISHPTAAEYTDNVATNAYVSEVSGNYRETWTTGK